MAEFNELSELKNPEGVLAVVAQAENTELQSVASVVLEDIQDPGNLGTILRMADWWGFKQIICTKGSVDCYHSKTLRASMGAIFRVNVVYLEDILSLLKIKKEEVVIADLSEQSISSTALSKKNYFVFGNEANGISASIRSEGFEVFSLEKKGEAESLNVAMACMGILTLAKQST